MCACAFWYKYANIPITWCVMYIYKCNAIHDFMCINVVFDMPFSWRRQARQRQLCDKICLHEYTYMYTCMYMYTCILRNVFYDICTHVCYEIWLHALWNMVTSIHQILCLSCVCVINIYVYHVKKYMYFMCAYAIKIYILMICVCY